MKRNFADIRDFDEEEDDDESDVDQWTTSKKFETKPCATIYLVDAREKMFLPSFEETKLPIIRCLESVRSAMRMKIFHLEKCLCCIILLGTKKVDNRLKINNVTVVQELELLGAHHILKIDELIKAIEELSYESQYGYSKFSLGDALWLSSHTFRQKSQNLNKTVIFFTNDDNPTSNDPYDRNRAIVHAQDLHKSFITFDVVFIGQSFDSNKFYKKIIQASKNDADYVIPDPVTSVSEIVNRITKTSLSHVKLLRVPFIISDVFQIGVSIHFLVRKSKILFKVKLSKATNEVVTTKTEYFEEETGSVVSGDNLIKCQVVANLDINFRPSELKRIQEIGEKELRLLGFKPASVIRLENFVKPCAFAYPDDSEYNGSSVFFTALLKRCIAKQVVAICTFRPRTTSSYRFVALIAQDEHSKDEKNQQLPPGFIVFFLPFAEEVRTIEERATQRANPEQVETAVNLIKKLKFNYRVSHFRNPKIRHHWAAIEALALDLREVQEVTDSTVPDYDLLCQRSGQIAKEFLESVYEEDYDPHSFTVTTTKPRLVKQKTKQKMKQKTKGKEQEMEEYIRQGKGEMLSNDTLKTYLKSVGVTKGLSKMKKSELLDKARHHLKLK